MTNKIPWNKKEIDKDLLYDLYVNQELTSEEVAEILGCTSKTVRNYLHRFNIPIRPNGEAVKLQRSKWSDEKELERSRKYHNTWANKSQKEKDDIIRKRLESPNINSPEAIDKAHQTRLQNGTTNKSKSEDDFYNKLLLMGYSEDDIIRNYVNDSRYPYNCDFYIKSKDLFIEYQGHQTHGPDIFDKNNDDHIKLLIKYQDKGYDMTTWFKRDPQKLQTAIKNKINLILVYQKGKIVYYVHNGKITTININDINKI